MRWFWRIIAALFTLGVVFVIGCFLFVLVVTAFWADGYEANWHVDDSVDRQDPYRNFTPGYRAPDTVETPSYPNDSETDEIILDDVIITPAPTEEEED